MERVGGANKCHGQSSGEGPAGGAFLLAAK